jgi:hypothetical protein
MRRLRVLVRKGLEQELEKRVKNWPEGGDETTEIKIKADDAQRPAKERILLRQRACRILEALARQQGYGLYIDAAEVVADGVRLVVRRQRDQEAIEEASKVLKEGGEA